MRVTGTEVVGFERKSCKLLRFQRLITPEGPGIGMGCVPDRVLERGALKLIIGHCDAIRWQWNLRRELCTKLRDGANDE